jgi:hypothetical protein
MPTNRTRRRRDKSPPRIGPEAIAAWRTYDWNALHRALGLNPWHSSPLPGTRENLDPDNPHDQVSIRCRAALIEAAGMPDCRAAFAKELADAESTATYYKKLVKDPSLSGIGTRCDPVSRRKDYAAALATVAYIRQAIAKLDAHGRPPIPTDG